MLPIIILVVFYVHYSHQKQVDVRHQTVLILATMNRVLENLTIVVQLVETGHYYPLRENA